MQNKIIEISNINFQKKFFNKKIPASIFDISLMENGVFFGSCIRKLFFKETNFTKSNFNLYETEKLISKFSSLRNLIFKYKKFSGYNFLDTKKLELKSIDTTIEANDFLITNNEIFMFHVMESKSEFDNLDKIPLTKHFPSIISCLTSYPSMEINIIYKSFYSYSEKLFNIKLIQGALLINNNLTDFNIGESSIGVKITMNNLKTSIQNKEIPKITRTDQCNWCYWKEICKYL